MAWPLLILACGAVALLVGVGFVWSSTQAELVKPSNDPKAEAKANALLLANLSPQQRLQYAAYGHFDAVGSRTGTRYRIFHGTSRNVVELTDDNPWIGRCFMPEGDLVAGDCMLAQKIAIENYEDEVLRTALRF